MERTEKERIAENSLRRLLDLAGW